MKKDISKTIFPEIKDGAYFQTITLACFKDNGHPDAKAIMITSQDYEDRTNHVRFWLKDNEIDFIIKTLQKIKGGE